MIHIISNNQDTVNDINVGGIIILDKEKKTYFTNNLNFIIDYLMSSTKKTRDEIINYIIGIDYLYEKRAN